MNVMKKLYLLAVLGVGLDPAYEPPAVVLVLGFPDVPLLLVPFIINFLKYFIRSLLT